MHIARCFAKGAYFIVLGARQGVKIRSLQARTSGHMTRITTRLKGGSSNLLSFTHRPDTCNTP